MKMQITCKEATTFIIQREEGKLSFKKRIQLWMHFGICSLCKLFFKQSKFISRNAAHLHQHVEENLSQTEKNEIVAVLQQK